ncbi:MAG: CYTH domain-containing protein [Desulfuromonadales bacterium]|nr:MAG: CYTH domain-containing protein [Desulfuromonadales bacterium]
MIEIERKFLVTSLPDGLMDETLIQQGYLAHDEHEHMEIRLRRYGKKQFLTIKEGAGLSRRETEVEITRRQFDQLWPSTEGRRLEKKRSCIRVGGYKVEVDQYLGELEPLVVAEVEFSSVEESERFEKTYFMGREVTGVDAYKNLFLALHGMPENDTSEHQIGALPYLMRGGRLHFVLVTNSTQTRWILPKGQPEPGMSRHDVAVMEAMEEAGVIGSCIPRLHLACRQSGERTLQIYPLKVTTILKNWPEMGWRKRMVVPLDKALKMISDPNLSLCVQRLANRLVS